RDWNAAINILQKALYIVGRTKIYASGETSSWLVGEILLANEDSLNEESTSF
ncbi:MAG: transposase, partial [Kamptonema sp. SIO1D9]|nr:transposase [Kamptonema sp. SIO1D9]